MGFLPDPRETERRDVVGRDERCRRLTEKELNDLELGIRVSLYHKKNIDWAWVYITQQKLYTPKFFFFTQNSWLGLSPTML